MASKKKPTLPRAGAAFAFPIGDGRYSVCRVILDADSEASKRWGTEPMILIVTSAWVGDVIPRVEDPSLRPILHLTHHNWSGKPNALWVSEEVPPDFIPIGAISPTPEEADLPCLALGGWRGVTMQPLRQWR